MIANITRHLNKIIFVSIPALFEDGACRPFTLLGAELHGLWLQSDELTRRLLPDDKRGLAATSPAVFVPFAQIAGVLVAGSPPQSPEQQPEKKPSNTAAGTGTRTKSTRRTATVRRTRSRGSTRTA
jgi:hypothetical protein